MEDRITRWQSQDPNLVSWQMEDRPSVGGEAALLKAVGSPVSVSLETDF